MNQKELIEAIAEKGHSKHTAEAVLKALGEVVQKCVSTDGDVTLPGIGKISVKHRAARAGRNPSTGESLHIEAKRVPSFTAAKALKDAVA